MTDVIGVARPRLDAPEKVTGQTRFAADGYVHGLLHARLVLSTETHALIQRINGADALEISGVVAVLTAADLPTATQSTDRTAEPLWRARRSSSRASRWRWSSPRPRLLLRTESRRCSSTTSRWRR